MRVRVNCKYTCGCELEKESKSEERKKDTKRLHLKSHGQRRVREKERKKVKLTEDTCIEDCIVLSLSLTDKSTESVSAIKRMDSCVLFYSSIQRAATARRRRKKNRKTFPLSPFLSLVFTGVRALRGDEKSCDYFYSQSLMQLTTASR